MKTEYGKKYSGHDKGPVDLIIQSHLVRLEVCHYRVAVETNTMKIYLTVEEKYLSEVILGLREVVVVTINVNNKSCQLRFFI